MGYVYTVNSISSREGSAIPQSDRRAAGRYYTLTAAGHQTSQTDGDGFVYLTPFWYPGGMIDRLSCYVTVAGSAGSTTRLGVYLNDGATGYDYPGTLLVDGGTVSTTGTGAKEVSFTAVYVPRGVNWVALASQGGAATQPTFFSTNNAVGLGGASAGTGDGKSLSQGGTGGALPADAVTGLAFLGPVGACYVIQARAA